MGVVFDEYHILEKLRSEVGLSREQLVRRPELEPPVATRTYARWERGEVGIKVWRLPQLEAIFGTQLRLTLNLDGDEAD